MESSRGSSLVTAIWCMVIIGVVLVVILPVLVSETHCTASTCQSNIKQLGNSFRMYIQDWNDKYPPNRGFLAGKKPGFIRAYVKLSTPGARDPKTKNPIRFTHGYGWVECLYGYAEPTVPQNENESSWKCPEATNGTWPDGSKTATVSYAYNRNMIELSEASITCNANLMLCREMDRLVNSELRPINNSIRNPKAMPLSPFLNDSDRRIGKTNSKLHGTGSNVLLADGHVKFFNNTYFPNKPEYDKETKQWFNFAKVPARRGNKEQVRSIAITP